MRIHNVGYNNIMYRCQHDGHEQKYIIPKLRKQSCTLKYIKIVSSV